MKLKNTMPIEIQEEIEELLQEETETWMMILVGPNKKRLTTLAVIGKGYGFEDVFEAIDEMTENLKGGVYGYIVEMRE